MNIIILVFWTKMPFRISTKLNIDGIMSFAVDPGVSTAAYVSEKLNLPSSGPYESILILQNKGLFREFLKKHNFNVPKSRTYTNSDEALHEFSYFDLPVIVKPVDSAGSKGVMKVSHEKELANSIQNALKFSASKTIIIEEFLEAKQFSSDTDCFSINGAFKFISFSNQRFDPKSPNPFTPSAYSWPSSISDENKELLKSELQRLIHLLNMKSAVYNIEVREATNGKAYIMEVSPRGGGNRLSEMLNYATKTDLISCAIQAALGEEIQEINQPIYDGYWAEIILYSNQSGAFKELQIDHTLEGKTVEVDLWIEKGDYVNAFTGANEAIGTLVLKFDSSAALEEILSDYKSYIKVIVE